MLSPRYPWVPSKNVFGPAIWPDIADIYAGLPTKDDMGSRSTFNLRAGSTFPVPVCTISPELWVNKADTQ